jgi:hypothetical protein
MVSSCNTELVRLHVLLMYIGSVGGLAPVDENSSIQLSSLKYVATIGVGGFGRVELVRFKFI